MTLRRLLPFKKRRIDQSDQPQSEKRTAAVVQYTLPSGRVLTVEADAAAIFERSLDEHAEIWAELAKS